MENRITEVTKKRKRIIDNMPDWEDIIRGSLIKYYLTCGTKGCRCHKAPKYKHGPYWYISVGQKASRNKMYKINNAVVKIAKRKIVNYENAWKGLCEISELNIVEIRQK